MRQPILTLLLILLAFVTGYEIQRRQTEDVWVSKGKTAEYFRSQATASQQAGTVPNTRNQENRKAEKAQPERADALRPVSSESPENEMNQTQGQLLALLAERDRQSQESLRSEIFGEMQFAELKAEREQDLSQLKDQLTQEQAIESELSRKLRELQNVNIDTPEQREVQTKVTLQKKRVSELRSQFAAYQLEVAAANARDRILAGTSAKGNADSLDQQIRVAQERLKEQQQQFENLQQLESKKEAD